jgi:hypothetical protein
MHNTHNCKRDMANLSPLGIELSCVAATVGSRGPRLDQAAVVATKTGSI